MGPAPIVRRSVWAGRCLADGDAGGGDRNAGLCARVCERAVVADLEGDDAVAAGSEHDLLQAMDLIADTLGVLVESAGAVGIARFSGTATQSHASAWRRFSPAPVARTRAGVGCFAETPTPGPSRSNSSRRNATVRASDRRHSAPVSCGCASR